LFVRPSVRPTALNNSAPNGQIFMKFEVMFFIKSVEEIQISLKCDKQSWYLRAHRYAFSIISRSVLLKMRDVSEQPCRQNQSTDTTRFLKPFFQKSCRLCNYVEKTVVSGRNTNENGMTYAHFILGT
jgi:hypothetical protein